MVRQLGSGTGVADARQAIAKVLWKLASDSPANKRAIAAAGGVRALQELRDLTTDAETREFATRALEQTVSEPMASWGPMTWSGGLTFGQVHALPV